MTPATSRPELERWLTSAAFNAYYRFRLREFRAGECTIEVPFRDEFERPGGAVSGPVFMAAADVAIWLAVVTRRGADGTLLTHHTGTYARTPDQPEATARPPRRPAATVSG